MFITPSIVDITTCTCCENDNYNSPVNMDRVLFFKKNIFDHINGTKGYRILFIFSMDNHIPWLYKNESAMIEAFEKIMAISTKTI